jgi:hypothetical protein
MTALRKTLGIVLAAAAASLFIAGPVVMSPTPAFADGLQCSLETCDGEGVCEGTIVSVETEEECAESGGLLVEG